MRNFVYEAFPEGEGTRMRRVSDLTRQVNEMVLPIPPDQLKERIQRWTEGLQLIQRAFPDLTDDQREFILSGATPEEWDALFKEEE